MTSQGQPGIAAAPHLQCTPRPGERGCRWFLATAPPALLTGLVALLGSLLLAAEARTQDLASDRAVLVALYNATDGPNWLNKQNWLSGEPLEEWYGVTVQHGRVTGLLLFSNQLSGTIPSELGNLAYLERLDLSGNQLRGSIRPELGNLDNLEVLSFSGNQLRGRIPSELRNLANLRELDLHSNRLTGPIPSELSHLARLEKLSLSINRLTGTLPSALGNLANLRELDLHSNRLTGPIPSMLSRLTNLQRLVFRENRLVGRIPLGLGRLVNLQELNLQQNQLTGPIPPELGGLVNLQELDLSRNKLTGPVPSELGNLAKLERLNFIDNQLTGPIPPELGNPANLQWLNLGANGLTGSIPSELRNLTNLVELGLGSNQLRGSIPPELGNLSNLVELGLRFNQLTGLIPSELGNLVNLERLSLGRNRLRGPIPPELGKLANLQWLDLFINELTGPIPSELGSLDHLEWMHLSGNRLTGLIPPELGSLANLQELLLSNNLLTGAIPSELGSLAKLKWMSLSDNRLTGPIPPELGNLAVERLDLFDNRLTGSIPPELGDIANLNWLDLGFNQLTGAIPLSYASLVALESLQFPMNHGLCAGAEPVIRNWLDGIRFVVGPDCSPSITLSATPIDLVEGRATSVMLTATQTPVSDPTNVKLLFGGTAKLGENHDYTLRGFSGLITIPANRASGNTVLVFSPRADGLIEGTENIILQAFVGSRLFGLFQASIEGSTVLTLSDRAGCAFRDRAALEDLYRATGGLNWIETKNWLSNRPLSEWHGVTVDNDGCVTHLDLSSNHLTGPLPLQLGYLVNLEGLMVSGNQLTGLVPPSFTNLVALKRFWFHLNTSLCAQADTSIRTWFNGIEDVRGPNCSFLETMSSIFVPVILSASGRNDSLFTSEMTLTNRGSEEAILRYTYTAHAGGGSGTATDRLAPWRQRTESDALGYLRRRGVPIPRTGNRIGTLRVEVTGSSAVSVVTRTTADLPEGRAGLAYPGIDLREGFQEAVYLCGLRQNDRDRSNVAIQNMGARGEGAITLRTTVFSGEADDTVSWILEEVTLNPGGFHQYSGLLRELGSPAQGYVRVEKVDGDAPFYAYGVINDNFNSDGSFVFPVTESSLVGTSGQTLPVIVETGNFKSELTITNFSAAEKTIEFSFVGDAVETGDATAEFSLRLEAGQQTVLPNLVRWMRQEEVVGIGPAGRDFVGALFATPAEGDMSGIVIGARTGSSDGRGGQYSVFYNAVPYGAAFNRTAWIDGLRQDEENRSNLVLVNTGEVDSSDSIFNLQIYDGVTGGLATPITGVRVPARGWYQFNGFLGNYTRGITQGYVRIRKVSGANPFLAYGVINDGGAPGQRSGDGAYLPGRK